MARLFKVNLSATIQEEPVGGFMPPSGTYFDTINWVSGPIDLAELGRFCSRIDEAIAQTGER